MRLDSQLLAWIAAIPELAITGSDVEHEMAPHIVHFAFAGMKAEVVVHALEQKGICISTRSACTSGESEPSEIMLAIGISRDLAIAV